MAATSTAVPEPKVCADLQLETAQFGDLHLFREGLEGLIGLPPLTFEALRAQMEEEHRDDCNFTPPNYPLTQTTLHLEWQFVVEPCQDRVYSNESSSLDRDEPFKRRRRSLEDIKKEPEYKNAKLHEVELIALRLYTGPSYCKYNRALRDRFKHRGSKDVFPFVATVYAIYSGLIKLAEQQELKEDGFCYRGIGLKLPEQMTQVDRMGFKGGCEIAFMSCTYARKVAAFYLGQTENMDKRNILKIRIGQVDRGTSLRWLSQYPAEDEVLFPPLSNIELMEDSTEVEERIDGLGGTATKCTVRVHACRLNVNLRTPKLEELFERRKQLHVSVLKNTCLEVQRYLAAEIRKLPEGYKGKVRGEGGYVAGLVNRLCDKVLKKHEEMAAQDYLKEATYQALVEEAALLFEQARSVFEYWRDTPAFFGDDLLPQDATQASLAEIHRIIIGVSHAEYLEASRLGERRAFPQGRQHKADTDAQEEQDKLCALTQEEEAADRAAKIAQDLEKEAKTARERADELAGLVKVGQGASIALEDDADLKEKAARVLELLNEDASQEAVARAAGVGKRHVLNILIDAGAPVGRLALSSAAQFGGSASNTKLLLEAFAAQGSDACAPPSACESSSFFNAPLYAAAYNGSDEIVGELLLHASWCPQTVLLKALCVAARKNRLAAFKKLWEHQLARSVRCQPQEPTHETLGKKGKGFPGHSCLSECCWTGSIEIVKFIWESMSDSPEERQAFFWQPVKEVVGSPNSKFPRSPLHFAAQYGHIEIVRFWHENVGLRDDLKEDPGRRRPPRSTVLGQAMVGTVPGVREDIVKLILSSKFGEGLLCGDVCAKPHYPDTDESFFHLVLRGRLGKEVVVSIINRFCKNVDTSEFCSWFKRPWRRRGYQLSCLEVACLHENAPVIEFLVGAVAPHLLKECIHDGKRVFRTAEEASAELKKRLCGRSASSCAEVASSLVDPAALSRDLSTASLESFGSSQGDAVGEIYLRNETQSAALWALFNTPTRDGRLLLDLLQAQGKRGRQSNFRGSNTGQGGGRHNTRGGGRGGGHPKARSVGTADDLYWQTAMEAAASEGRVNQGEARRAQPVGALEWGRNSKPEAMEARANAREGTSSSALNASAQEFLPRFANASAQEEDVWRKN